MQLDTQNAHSTITNLKQFHKCKQSSIVKKFLNTVE
jgi:hypothetical protein